MSYNQDNLKGKIQNAKRKLQLSFQNFKQSELVKSYHDYPLVTMVHIEYRLNITHLYTFYRFFSPPGFTAKSTAIPAALQWNVCKPEESKKPLSQC